MKTKRKGTFTDLTQPEISNTPLKEVNAGP